MKLNQILLFCSFLLDREGSEGKVEEKACQWTAQESCIGYGDEAVTADPEVRFKFTMGPTWPS